MFVECTTLQISPYILYFKGEFYTVHSWMFMNIKVLNISQEKKKKKTALVRDDYERYLHEAISADYIDKKRFFDLAL